jgi:hypothetical protein
MKNAALIASSLILLAAPARAQTRPLLTEEASTARQGTIVLETGADVMRHEPNFLTGEERTRFDGPLLRLVWSPGDAVEIDLEWVARVAAFGDPTFGDVSDWGDVTLRAKTRFIAQEDHGFSLAARFNVTLPETHFGNGLGPNALRMSAQMLLSRCGRVCVHANAGLGINDEVERPHEQRDFLHYGFALTGPEGAALTPVAEIAGLAGNGRPGADARSEIRAGARWQRGRVRWDAALRRGLAKADGDWGLTVGLSWRLQGPRG